MCLSSLSSILFQNRLQKRAEKSVGHEGVASSYIKACNGPSLFVYCFSSNKNEVTIFFQVSTLKRGPKYYWGIHDDDSYSKIVQSSTEKIGITEMQVSCIAALQYNPFLSLWDFIFLHNSCFIHFTRWRLYLSNEYNSKGFSILISLCSWSQV